MSSNSLSVPYPFYPFQGRHNFYRQPQNILLLCTIVAVKADMSDEIVILKDRLYGLLLGTAVGDSLGLPAEGLSRKRIASRWDGHWRHRFINKRGMLSDDTEHTLLVAQSILGASNNPLLFQNLLAWKLRFWLLGLPAGIGLATLRAILKLWLGFPPTRSGVHSAGNGPAMRSAIIGAFFANDPERLHSFISSSTRLTHTDPKAETAALAVAHAARYAIQFPDKQSAFLNEIAALSTDSEWTHILKTIHSSLANRHSTLQFADALGLSKGVSGYAYHTVPVALYAWIEHGSNFRAALESVLNCGGDTDTTGAIIGALSGVTGGSRCIPKEWIEGIWDWPRSCKLIESIACRLAHQRTVHHPLGPVPYFWPGILPRNLLFMLIVLLHGFGRLFYIKKS